MAWFQFSLRVQIADLQPARSFWMNLIRVVTTLCLSLAAAYTTKSAVCVLLANAVGQLAGSVIYPMRGFSIDCAKLNRSLGRAAFGFGLPVAVSMTVAGLGTVASRFLLDQLASTEAVGQFTAANFAVQNVLALLSFGIGQATYPLAVKAVEAGDPIDLKRQLSDNFTLLFGTVLPSAVALSLIAPGLMPFFVGREFVSSVIELTPWMGVAAVLASMRAQYFDYSFQLAQKTGYLVFILASTVIINIGLNFWLIPRYRELGATMALVFSLVPSLLLAMVLGRRALPMPVPLRGGAQIIAATLVMACALVALSDLRGITGLLFQTLLGTLAYAAVVIGLDVMGVRGKLAGELLRIGKKLRHRTG
jgi:O-antigen/teichoic acid export membrane protein